MKGHRSQSWLLEGRVGYIRFEPRPSAFKTHKHCFPVSLSLRQTWLQLAKMLRETRPSEPARSSRQLAHCCTVLIGVYIYLFLNANRYVCKYIAYTGIYTYILNICHTHTLTLTHAQRCWDNAPGTLRNCNLCKDGLGIWVQETGLLILTV